MQLLLESAVTPIRIGPIALVWLTVVLCAPSPASADDDAAEFFERRVRPLLAERCYQCHGDGEIRSGLRLSNAEKLFQGGHGGPVVIPGQPDESRLIHVVRGQGEPRMPPEGELSGDEIETLVTWIRDGAVWPGYALQPKRTADGLDDPTEFTEWDTGHWAFVPLTDASAPDVSDAAWIASPIDRFILAQLEQVGLRPAPPADRRTLLRRVTFDLTGLPPTRAEIERFIADESPDAFARVVDRLLASQRYGQRWGRHWLDVARYAESAGHDGNNAYLHAWRYRDYVIDAFNEDKPYDRFVVEQLAGDLLPKTGDPKRDYDQVAATGFLQVGPKPVVMRDKRQMLLDIVDEQLHTTGVAFMGLTIGCARCHDHMFDPIPTKDYYSLAGVFASTRVMADHVADSMWIEEEVPGPDGEPVKLMTVRDFPNPRDLRVHNRGSYRNLGAEAPRRLLQVIEGVDCPPIETSGSGRLELAEWIASPENPLTARVMVNRVWQHHFGRGLVQTSDNFGVQGYEPTHPDLLDWLAAKFIGSGWSVKSLHRLILNTSAYRQSYVENDAALAEDPENELLWRMPRRRLDAESIRDAMLAISDELDDSLGGTLFTAGFNPLDEDRELYVVDVGGKESFAPFQQQRRSVYLPVIRNSRPESLRLFDVANSHEPSGVRGETTVPPQMLYLMNSRFVRERAEALAMCLLSPGASDRSETIKSLYALTLGRGPTEEEVNAANGFLTDYRSLLMTADPAELAEASDLRRSVERYSDLVREHDGLVAYHRIRGIALNGVDQRLEFTADDSLNSADEAITVECWIKPEDVRPFMMIVGRDSAAARYWKLGLYGRDYAGQRQNVVFSQFFRADLGGERAPLSRALVAPVGEWTHVAFSYGNGRRRLYVNGDPVDEADASGPVPTGDVPLTIGSRANDTEWFRGAINHVAIYADELDPFTVSRHYRAFRRAADHEIDAAELFAMRALCQSLLCMNEFIYVE